MTTRRARVTERSFYDPLKEVLRAQGGTAVSEISYNSEPDIVFDLRGRRWLLSVKIGETPRILKDAFLQYQRHKAESGCEHGLILFLPERARRVAASQSALATAVGDLPATCLVDTPIVQDEYSSIPFPTMVSRLIHNVVPQIERRDEQGYPMPVVIRFLLQHVEDMMAAINLSEGQLLRLVTDRQLVTKIGSLNLQRMADIGRFLGSYIVLSQVFFLRLLATRPA